MATPFRLITHPSVQSFILYSSIPSLISPFSKLFLFHHPSPFASLMNSLMVLVTWSISHSPQKQMETTKVGKSHLCDMNAQSTVLSLQITHSSQKFPF
ncbi:hypothetical protein BKA69DRAFT_518179 [Paraphysoderma sedebokerense]|nr:hypothetical protein BKA69DRAFT_518179 [Paraphysoderma sedebokerense]